ncbi:MAG: helix-turn-helix domain-containing protein [Oscillospiraceae bacterium]|nr:helix-turn-helix domain-containing protein [Oscillospiraceae bacterium]
MKSFQYTETKYLLTVQETARVLGVSVHTVYRLINSGELSAIKVSSRKTVIKAEELERYINRK